MEFSRQGYWSGLPFLAHRIFLTEGSNMCFLYLLCWQADSWPLCQLGNPLSLFFSPSFLSLLTQDFLSRLCHQLLLSCDCPSLIHIYPRPIYPDTGSFTGSFRHGCLCHLEFEVMESWMYLMKTMDSLLCQQWLKVYFFFFILALSGSHLLKSIWTPPQNIASCFNC